VDEPAPTFTARRVEQTIWVDYQSAEPLRGPSCLDNNDPVIEQKIDGGWVPLRDDRHLGVSNPGYYLDGRYIRPSSNLGCDMPGCYPLGNPIRAGEALEYVKTGMASPPDDDWAGSNSFGVPADPADTVETIRVEGPLRVRFTYVRGSGCDESEYAVVEVDDLHDAAVEADASE
jgi:hypothetical protein